ncbi:probable DNA-3-methyladenine glycosylase 2 [Neltuma alba]|uniref:probable DNA-3-methyladenine glycosylase 2 n=1 Tax=Neltuma alba TaxID=207710 RepID=UPI0010A35380|nr:probable DNA-3-methyladenine glycosylase 2 [Prosopis alba]
MVRRTRSQAKGISDSELQSQDSRSPTTTAISLNPPPPTSSKLSFRARKIRRVTSDADDNKRPQIPDAEASRTSHSEANTFITEKETPSASPSVLPMIVKPLTLKSEIDLALQHLRLSDSLLAYCIDSFRPPEFPTHRPAFLSLTKSIVCQQLSNQAAKTIHTRFVSLCGGEASVLPETVLGLTVQQLREVGISGHKAGYIHDLASKYREGLLSDSSILEMDDETLFNKLTMVKGIGPWSVHMFMIFTLHRPDVLPVGDLVVRRGVERLYGLKALPKPSQMEKLCEKWKPYRSVGAWYMYRLMEAKGVLPTLSAVEVAGSTVTEQQQTE